MITRARLALAGFTLALVASIAVAVVVIAANDDNGGDNSTRDLTRDLTAEDPRAATAARKPVLRW